MKTSTFPATEKIVVDPVTRRDASPRGQGELDVRTDITSMLQMLQTLDTARDLDAISGRLNDYVEQVETLIHSFQAAINHVDIAKGEKLVREISEVCSEIGAIRMIRLSYQAILAVGQGKEVRANELLNELELEFGEVKKTLRVAI